MRFDDENDRTRTVSRRQFLRGVAGGALGVYALDRLAPLGAQTLPPPKKGIDHVIVVMMENRSFDHFLGWLPGADGRQAGLTYLDEASVAHDTHPLAPDFQGCGHPDPDHSFEGGRVEYNNGACDGWLRAGTNDEYAIGFYQRADLSFFGRAAADWTTADRYFSATMAGTFPNRFYQHAAQTDRFSNSFELSTLPTIWDRLAEHGVSGRYYFSDVPFLALWGSKYLPISRPISAFFTACARGLLPAVSFVEPRFLGEENGLSNDDHPHADIRNGEAFLNLVYSAVVRSPAWKRTVLVINYDEWGGFFDHVPPPFAPIPAADQGAAQAAGITADGLLGFRVPAVIVSPFARQSHVTNVVFDHTSVLRFIEWRWDLPPLTVRDASANNIADILDFNARTKQAPLYDVPPGPFGSLCGPLEPDKWLTVLEIARAAGWPI